MERRDDIGPVERVNHPSSGRRGILLLFPGALGDFLCFAPTALAFEALGIPVTIAAHASTLELLASPSITRISIDRAEVSDLFADTAPKPATVDLFGGYDRVVSWTGANHPGFAERLARLGNRDVTVAAFRGMAPRQHAVDYYASCAGVSPKSIRPADLAYDSTWREHTAATSSLGAYVVVHPGSGSPSKNWQGFEPFLATWDPGMPMVLTVGPADSIPERLPPSALALANLSLRQLADLLAHATYFLGNDSGVSHLAAAVGTKGTTLFGPSDPDHWAPRGLRILRATKDCTACRPDTFCTHRLSIDDVAAAVTDGFQEAGYRSPAQAMR